MNSNKHTVIHLLGLSSIALALTFMILPNYHSVLAQQQITTNPIGTSNITSQQQNQNWTGSISLFSPILDAFKSKIHATLNDATTNAIMAAGGSNASAIAAFIHPKNGFLVYDVFVLDSSNNVHRVIIDPGNGQVLSNQLMSLMDMMSKVHSAPAPFGDPIHEPDRRMLSAGPPAPGDLIIAPLLSGDGISTPERNMLLCSPIGTGGGANSTMMMLSPGMLLRLSSELGGPWMMGPIDTGPGHGPNKW